MRRLSVALAVRLISMMSLPVTVAAVAPPAFGRDLDGRNAASPRHDWFEHLPAEKGLCGSFSDGYVVADADWGAKDGHYRVRLPKAITSNEIVWVNVPDQAVIAVPNKAGRTMVWPLYSYAGVSIGCFMPGNHT
jgi:hypothetical protein